MAVGLKGILSREMQKRERPKKVKGEGEEAKRVLYFYKAKAER
jgi:hypothetical protein